MRLIFVFLAAMATLLPARGLEYPWVFLTAKSDSRDAEMLRFDEADSRSAVATINDGEPLFRHQIVWKKTALTGLLRMNAPFCEMRFDAVRQVSLAAQDKDVLRDYFKRGGFILFYIDTYPYAQSEFWPVKRWPMIDFLTRDLPAADPDFTVGKIDDSFALFHAHYHTQTAVDIRYELDHNPNSPNRTVLYYKGRLCAFVMGRYGQREPDGPWLPDPRPFPENFSMDPRSYRLIVNVYVYSLAR